MKITLFIMDVGVMDQSIIKGLRGARVCPTHKQKKKYTFLMRDELMMYTFLLYNVYIFIYVYIYIHRKF